MRSATIGILSGAVFLAACSAKDQSNNSSPTDTSTTGVAREIVPEPTPTAAPTVAAAIQTQPGPSGSTVSLNRVGVTGDVMTVALTYSGIPSCCQYVDAEQIGVIDDATAQRISLLKDNSGKWMAAPLANDGRIRIGESGDRTQVWFKFPAPPASSRTVSITIPEVAPFDAVPVTR